MPTIPLSYPPRLRQRLTGFDYTTPGFYFVTVCIQDRLPLFGAVVSAEMQPSPAGDAIHHIWEDIPHRYPGIELDTLMVMPNHLHALLSIGDEHTLSLSEVIHHLKARSTARYARGVRESGWPRFHRVLWQRGFYDRVIRGDQELNRVREYILTNPMRWGLKRAAQPGGK